MDVYRNYGLNVTIGMLRRLTKNAKSKPDKNAISVYFACCMSAITRDTGLYNKYKCNTGSPLQFLVLLTDLLIDIDNKSQISLAYDLEPITQTLPDDVLNVLFNTIRITKKFGSIITEKEKILRDSICNAPLTKTELGKASRSNKRTVTEYDNNVCWCSNFQYDFTYEITTISPYKFKSYSDITDREGTIIAYSYKVLKEAYGSRVNCVNESNSEYSKSKTIEYLQNLQKFSVNDNNIVEACALYVQLYMDLYTPVGDDIESISYIIQDNLMLENSIRSNAKTLTDWIE
jgi:hypothetical protein